MTAQSESAGTRTGVQERDPSMVEGSWKNAGATERYASEGDAGEDNTDEDGTGEASWEGAGAAEDRSNELRLEFTGSAKEYYRIWIVNACLTLLTLGVYSAWAKVRKQRYIHSHVLLDGTPIEYLGTPGPILRGRLIGVVLMVGWYCASHLAPRSVPVVLVLGGLAAPWILVKSMAFRARSTAYRNIRFEFLGTTRSALVPVYGWLLLALVTLGFTYPWAEQRIRKFLIHNTWYGDTPGEFTASGGRFFQVYMKAGFIASALGVPIAFLSGLGTTKLNSVLVVIMSSVTLVVVYAYKQARIFNLCWRNTTLGGLFVRPELTFGGLLRIYATNSLAIVATLGLAIPWAMIRSLRYRIDHTKVYLEGSLGDFEAVEEPAQSSGMDVVDVFDLELAI